MAQPSEGDIDTVIAFTEFSDRNLIASALKAKNHNVTQVVNEILDDRTRFISTYGWDEKAFNAPREGTPNPSFVVHPADDGQVLQGVDPGYYQGQMGAPSRPPSRTNNRSPLSRLVDITSDSTGEAPYNSLDGMMSNQDLGNAMVPTSMEQEDAELQQAIAASVATSNIHSPQPQPQESGVTDAETGLPHFGPTNRTDYNQNEWAMITLNHDKPEPDPSRRKRQAGVPAFLRCRAENSWETHRVGAILTILHSIPGARNALLRLGGPAPHTYGQHPEWWKGKSILPSAVQETHNAGNLASSDESKPKWSEELHRLMAFLDSTERSYGTADVLADAAPEGQLSGTDSERDFFTFLLAYFCSDTESFETIRPLITTCEYASVQDDEAPTTHCDNFGILDLLFSKEQLVTAESIYSLWDRMFYMDYSAWAGREEGATCALITGRADVLTLRFTHDDGLPKRIDIPEVFHLDRYLLANRAEISKIQRQALLLANALVRAEKAQLRVTLVVDPASDKEVDRIQLNKAAIAQVQTKRALIKQWALWRMHQEEKERTGEEPQILLPPHTPDDKINWTEEEMKFLKFCDAKVLQLEDELARVEEELAAINRERDKVIAAMRELERRLTVPDEKLGFTPQAAYTLRGVSSSVEVFYVCWPAEQDLMQLDEADSSVKPVDQWWKLGYVASDDDPIKAETTTYEKVMEEACGPGSKPILIYASKNAMEEKPDQLSEALQTFVRFDNRLFKKELTEEIPRDKKRGGFSSPASPSKRLNRSSSVDSMATNAASAGSAADDDDDMRDAPFDTDLEDAHAQPHRSTVGEDDMPDLIDLVDTSVPHVPPPPEALYAEECRAYTLPPPSETHSAPPSEVNRYPEPPIQPWPQTSSSSPARSSVREMANVSLDEVVNRGLADSGPPAVGMRHSNTFPPAIGQTKGPEMQERGGTTSPFFLHQAKGKGSGGTRPGAPGGMMDMELDEDKVVRLEENENGQ